MPASKNGPNILVFMCDQLNANVLECYGGNISTPNISKLANEGMVFDNAICPYPVCTPSRASIATGLYPHKHGIVHNTESGMFVNEFYLKFLNVPDTEEGITNNDVTYGKLLHEHGYQTFHHGQWHLFGDILEYYNPPFRMHYEYQQCMQDDYNRFKVEFNEDVHEFLGMILPISQSEVYKSATESVGNKWDDKYFSDLVKKSGRLEMDMDKWYDSISVKQTLETINNFNDKEGKPFMITCSVEFPHNPNVVASPYYEMFDRDKIQLPSNYENIEPRFENDWSRSIVKDLGEAGLRELLGIYYGQVKYVDDLLGKVLNTLDDNGYSENTIVLFTSDHGEMAGEHGMFWKSTSTFYDSVVKVPFIIWYPEVVQKGRTRIASNHTNILPTLADFVGAEIPNSVQGYSLVPYITGKKPEGEAPKYTFCERIPKNPQHTRNNIQIHMGSYMIRGEGWKYFFYPDGKEFLFDLSNDPNETINLADDISYRDRKEDLKAKLKQWIQDTI